MCIRDRATPLNTNSSVLDPVDLAITRGGDLQILQQLTEDVYSTTPTDVNINNLLWEQKETLRHSMSKPQVISNYECVRACTSRIFTRIQIVQSTIVIF